MQFFVDRNVVVRHMTVLDATVQNLVLADWHRGFAHLWSSVSYMLCLKYWYVLSTIGLIIF
jgi:hypothetical protein